MPRTIHNERWINNPERRVGERQLLRARLAGLSETDPLYNECLELLGTLKRDSRRTHHHA